MWLAYDRTAYHKDQNAPKAKQNALNTKQVQFAVRRIIKMVNDQFLFADKRVRETYIM